MSRLSLLLATSALVAVSALVRPAHAVNVSDDAGLRNAIFNANTGGDTAINFTGNITLAQSLPMITSNITLSGNGFTLDAANQGRAIFVASGSVTVSNLTIANARAQGGAGGSSTGGGGGGGLGAGAAVFVNSGAALTLNLVQVQNAAALGGAGGNGSSSVGGGGGGGLGGNGGSSTGAGGGGGGYAGNGGIQNGGNFGGGGGGGEFGTGGASTSFGNGGGGGGGQRGNGGSAFFTGGGGGGGATANGGDTFTGNSGTPGGAEGGAGSIPGFNASSAAAARGGGGGGGDGGAAGSGLASGGGGGAGNNGGAGGAAGIGGGGGGGSNGGGGAGGPFGGGGGSGTAISAVGGAGGFGGGGGGATSFGSTGGAGGFGAGGGGGGAAGGTAGAFGGAGGTGASPGGGGGAALGGAVFVATGGTLTIVDGGFGGSYTLTAGAGANGGAGSGQAQGRVMFLHGTGAINFSLSRGTTVTIAGDDAIAGTGALALAGIGTLTIGGANFNYTGTTTVNGGRLAVNGTLPGAVVINAGGILGGIGTLGATTINGGTLAPGNSIGTITLASLTMSAVSTYAVEVSPTAADRTNVAGAATIAGSVQATFQTGGYTPRSYTILSAAGGRAGTFDAIATSTPFLLAGLSYTPTDVLLNVSLNPAPTVPGVNTNQQRVLTALGQGFAAAGSIGDGFGSLLGLSSSQLPATLTSLSGEIGTGVQNPSFAMGGAFFNAMAGQMQRWQSDGGGVAQSAGTRVEFASAQPDLELAQAVPGGAWPPLPSVTRRYAAWAQGFGLSGSRDGDASAGSAGLSYSMGGGAAGFDVQLSPGLLLGASVAGSGSSFTLDRQPASGTVRAVFFGLYGSWTMGPLYVNAAAGYGHGQFTTTRTLTVGATTERAEGDFDGHQYGGGVEAGWRFQMQRYQLTPFAAVSVQSLHQNPYSETSTILAGGAPGTLGLSYQGQTTTSVRSFVGGQAMTTFALGERTTLTPRVRLAWAHEFNRDRQVNASFLSLPAAAFTVSGARPARDAAIVSAGVDVGLGHAVALYAQFDGDLSGNGNAYAGSGGVRISW